MTAAAEILASFLACAVAIPVVVIGWMRDPRARELDEQLQRDAESATRQAAAPHHPHVRATATPIAEYFNRYLTHVDGRPVRLEPVQERLIDVINGGRA